MYRAKSVEYRASELRAKVEQVLVLVQVVKIAGRLDHDLDQERRSQNSNQVLQLYESSQLVGWLVAFEVSVELLVENPVVQPFISGGQMRGDALLY